MTTHKESHDNRTKEYTSWLAMKQRCKDPNHKSYKNYGAKGITICEEWLDYEVFLRDVGRAPSKNHTLDRYPNKEGNYEPGNVRWATKRQQRINTKTPKNNKSGCKGVSWCKFRNKWIVSISKVKGKQRIIGSFDSLEEAIKLRKEAEKEYYDKAL